MRTPIAILLMWSFALAQQPAVSPAPSPQQQAIGFLRQALSIVAAVPEPEGRAEMLDRISVALFRAGDQAGSTAVLSEAFAAFSAEQEETRPSPLPPPPPLPGATEDSRSSAPGQLAMDVAYAARNHAGAGDKVGVQSCAGFIHGKLPLVTREIEQASILAEIAKAQIEVGDLDGGARSAALIPEKYSLRTDRLADIAAVRVRNGDIAGARQLAEGMGSVPAAIILRRIVDTQIEVKDVGGAAETAEGITQPMFHAEALAHIAEAQSKAGDTKAANLTFGQAAKAAGTWEGALNAIALSQARAGRFAQAFETIDAIPFHDHGIKTDTLTKVAVIAAKAKHAEVADQAFSQALMLAAKIDEGLWKVHVVRGIALAQTETGNVTAALNTAAVLPDNFRRGVLTEISALQARAGDVVGAEQTLSGFKHANLMQERDLAVAKAARGDLAGALQTGSGFPEMSADIFRAQAKSGGGMAAALAAAAAIRGPYSKAGALVGMAEGLLDSAPKKVQRADSTADPH